jgi:adenosyl cobinamide kinase/adenosyl cobinamide phosphate guanylyltransferase
LSETISESIIVRDYQKMLGYPHQEVVQRAETAYLVEVGIPIMMKGRE